MKIVRQLIENHLLCYPSEERKIKHVVLYGFLLLTSTFLPALAGGNNETIDGFSRQIYALTEKDFSLVIDYKNTVDDKAEIFQKCLDIPELQPYYPKNINGTYKQVYVMQTPISFPVNLAVSKFQQNVAFLERGDIYGSAIDAFLIFKDFSVNGNQAAITYDFNYNYTSSPAALEMVVMLQKIDNAWTVVDTKTNNR